VINFNAGGYQGNQMAGIANVSRGKSASAQFAGVYNLAKRISGVQVSGVLNMADTVYGLQVGLINIARVNKGGAIGLINLAKNGYCQLEINTSDIYSAGIGFRSGTPWIYTMLGAGYTTHADGFPAWGYYAGLGTTYGAAKRKWHLSTDLTAHQLMYRYHSMRLNTLATADLLLNIRLAKGLHLAAGPSLNVHIADMQSGAWNEFYADWQSQRSRFTHQEGNIHLASWTGWKAALRFF
jgi:hypothetical protein